MARKQVESSARQAAWRRLVEQWRESGLTQAAFCRDRRVSVSSFRWWKWKLGLPGRAPAEAIREVRGSESSVPAFVPVRIVEVAGRRATEPGGGDFELELPGGWRLRVPGDFESESLARLLAVVEEWRAC